MGDCTNYKWVFLKNLSRFFCIRFCLSDILLSTLRVSRKQKAVTCRIYDIYVSVPIAFNCMWSGKNVLGELYDLRFMSTAEPWENICFAIFAELETIAKIIISISELLKMFLLSCSFSRGSPKEGILALCLILYVCFSHKKCF